MGNEQATVSAGNKAQADKDACELYQLVDVHGGGELVDLMKAANLQRDFRQLDAAIQKKVLPFLYNRGKGKYVTLSELQYVRHCYKLGKELRPPESSSQQQRPALNSYSVIDSSKIEIGRSKVSPQPTTQWLDDRRKVLVCWDLYKRGPVGETILHICLLQANSVHADLAKRLLHNFPNILGDIYTSDQYYGETALHMAIVNEDPSMVKFLLDKDQWRLHERRCYGEFFCPDDQKRSRRDAVDSDGVCVSEQTNYSGYVYWGEFPLSFAACLGQEECVRLLVASNANLDAQDVNGNTALHMTVIRNLKSMFELLRSLGASLNIRNRQGLTPLTLAAKLARKEIFEYILEKERQVFWVYGDVMCAAYPLADVDSIDDFGRINTKSVLDLIVHGSELGHLDMVEGLVVSLLTEKWRTFVRFRFYRRLCFFCAYFILFVTAMLLRDEAYELTSAADATQTSPGNASFLHASGISKKLDGVCYAPYDFGVGTTENYLRAIIEASVLTSVLLYLVLAFTEVYHNGWKIFLGTLKYAPDKFIFLCSCLFVVLMVPGRFAPCGFQYEDVMATLAMLCTAPYFLFFCRGFKIVGPFVVMIYKMFSGDVVRFLTVYIIFVLGFSQSLYVVFLGYTNSTTPFSTGENALMGVFYMSTGQFGSIHDSLQYTRHSQVGAIVFVAYMVLVTILVINMFIAMMGNTYKLINEAQKEWLRQWANMVLVVEQSVTTDERLRLRKNYSQPLGDNGDGRRALVVRWRQSADEVRHMKADRTQINLTQMENIVRRKLHRRMGTIASG